MTPLIRLAIRKLNQYLIVAVAADAEAVRLATPARLCPVYFRRLSLRNKNQKKPSSVSHRLTGQGGKPPGTK